MEVIRKGVVAVVVGICCAGMIGGCSSSEEAADDPPNGTNPVPTTPTNSFRGSGNEPFWLVDVDFEEGTMRFATADGELDVAKPLPEPIHRPDVGSLIYRIETDRGFLDVSIFRRNCDDTMADTEYRYAVEVRVSREGVAEAQLFEGCGRYNGLGELSRIWQLTHIDGEEVPEFDEQRRVPTVEFLFAGRGMSGNGACNRFSGEFMSSEMTVTPGNLAVTRMACPELDLEQRYLSILQGRTHNVRFEEDRLQLTSDGGILEYRLSGIDPRGGPRP